MENFINFIDSNWAVIATALLAISEVMALFPKIKSNGIFQLIINVIKKLMK